MYHAHFSPSLLGHVGITWTDRQIVLERRRDVTTEDIGVVIYPCVWHEKEQLRLYYNGAGGGATGIGMAVASLVD